MTGHIAFNKPFVAGKELYYIAQAVASGQIAGDGVFTQRCALLLEQSFGICKALLTPSCTAALEMAAMLCDLGPGDEVIVPSYTFVSTANCFVKLGARPVFVDVREDTLNIDENLIERAISPRTKAIFPVHYAGVACEMDRINEIAKAARIVVVEDAAQGVNAFYKGRPLGTLGSLGCYSFHETKNIISGEGGALCVNDSRFIERAEIIRDKGTNRRQFNMGTVDKYTWVSKGSSYVPAEIVSAFLCAQLEMMVAIQARRQQIFAFYSSQLAPLEKEFAIRGPIVPEWCTPNYHMYYLLLPTRAARDALIAWMRARSIVTPFHYVPLHTSPMGRTIGCDEGALPVTESVAGRLIRLPMYYEISAEEQGRVVDEIFNFIRRHRGVHGIGSVSAA